MTQDLGERWSRCIKISSRLVPNYAQNFNLYSFQEFSSFYPLFFFFQAYYSKAFLFISKKIHLHILKAWWLQTVNKIQYDCSIRMYERFIRVYRSSIAIIINQPNNAKVCMSNLLCFTYAIVQRLQEKSVMIGDKKYHNAFTCNRLLI